MVSASGSSNHSPFSPRYRKCTLLPAGHSDRHAAGAVAATAEHVRSRRPAVEVADNAHSAGGLISGKYEGELASGGARFTSLLDTFGPSS